MSLRSVTVANTTLFSVDAAHRTVLVSRPGLFVVDERGAQRELAPLVVPHHHHAATQNADAWTGAAAWLRVSLRGQTATVLTTEGVWRYDVGDAEPWTRVAGHPTDPPANLSFEACRAAGYPVTVRSEGYLPRLGSHPVALSADGTVTVGAPNLRGLVASDHELYLWTQRIGESPVRQSVRLRSSVEALALSEDGGTIAFSEGRDLRVLKSGDTRTRRLAHDRPMIIRSLSVSHDGRFVAANWLFPEDARLGTLRAGLWNVASRTLLAEWRDARQLGFITAMGEPVLVLAEVDSSDRTEFVTALDQRVRHVISGARVRAVGGTLEFLAIRDSANVLTIYDAPALHGSEVGNVDPGQDRDGWAKLSAENANAVNRFLMIYTRLAAEPSVELILDAVDQLCWNALFLDPENVGAPVLWQLLQPSLPPANLGTLVALTLADCAGWAAGAPSLDVLLVQLADREPSSALFVAARAAWGRLDAVGSVGGPCAALVAAMCTGNADERKRQWHVLLRDAPDLIGSGQIRISELVLLARAIYVQDVGGDPESCFGWLRAQLRTVT